MTRLRFPYGISNFKSLVMEGYHYVDCTRYLELMECMYSRDHLFLHPRRLGKEERCLEQEMEVVRAVALVPGASCPGAARRSTRHS